MSNYSKSSKIRDTFINYFYNNSHKILDSSSIAPEDDNTILFTNAGMVQFKKWFTGEIKSKYKNVATVQKCLRAGGKHNDLDNVGFTPRHHTFFEMLGNFSFGGYFKEEAIFHAWYLLTKEFNLDKSKIIITVFKEDSESYNLWKKMTGFSDSQILKISTFCHYIRENYHRMFIVVVVGHCISLCSTFSFSKFSFSNPCS